MKRKVLNWLLTCSEDDVIDGAVWLKDANDWIVWNEQRLMAAYRDHTGDGTMEALNDT